jgi:hypothetical protein
MRVAHWVLCTETGLYSAVQSLKVSRFATSIGLIPITTLPSHIPIRAELDKLTYDLTELLARLNSIVREL